MRRLSACLPGLILFLLAPGEAPPASLVINEFVSSNQEGLVDEDGDTPDWIELYNPGMETVALAGWGLSDTEDDPRRWVFGEGSIPAGGFLVVFASNKDRMAPEFHTNFAISSSGEPLILTNPAGETVDLVEPVEVPVDVSMGRIPDAGGEWAFFAEPTPGAPNDTEPAPRVLPPPHFSRPGGFYTEPFDLSLVAGEPGVTIIYTLDGSRPDADNLGGTAYQYKQSYPGNPGEPFGETLERSFRSHLYEGGVIPIRDRSSDPNGISNINTTVFQDRADYFSGDPVFKGTVVRAIATREGDLPSEPVTQTYFVTEEGRGRYTLPVAALTIQEDHLFDYDDGIHVAGRLFDEWREENPDLPGFYAHRPANYYRTGREWEFPVHLEYFTGGPNPILSRSLGLRIHGGSSRQIPLKSFRLYARNAYDDSNRLDFPFFEGLVGRGNGEPITEFRRILLRNSGNEYTYTYFRDGYLQALAAPLGLDQQAYLPLVAFVNGEYWGLLNLRERPDRHHLASHHSIDPDDIAILENDAALVEGTEADVEDFLQLRQYVGNEDMADPVHYSNAAQAMDMENFIRYCALQIYVGNRDWPGNNFRFWRKRTANSAPGAPPAHDGRWRWILFDLDTSFGDPPADPPGYDSLLHATLEGGTAWPNPDWSTLLFRNLLQNREFRHQFINTMAGLMNSIFLPSNALPLLDEFEARIAPHLPEFRGRYIGAATTDAAVQRAYIEQRPAHVRQHMMEFFGLPGTAEVTVDTPSPRRGRVRVGGLTIDPDLAGIQDGDSVYPWSGTYFPGIPIEIEAVPDPNYRFVRWEGSPAAGEGRTVTIEPTGGLSLTAIFEPSLPPVVVDPVEDQAFIEGDAPMLVDLDSVFDDPNGAPLHFGAASNREGLVAAGLDGSLLTLTPLRRGDAEITLSASNGSNDPVEHSFRILVYPAPHPLSSGVFQFTRWDPGEPEFTYPDHMIFLQTDVTDPGLDHPLGFAYFVPHDDHNPDDAGTIGFPYNNTRRTRLGGLGEAGISFINTGRGRDLGGALVALDTTNVLEATVSWTAGTLLANEREQAIRLQYRLGTDGPFRDITGEGGDPVEYRRNVDFHVEHMPAAALPEDALGEPHVQLLWRYYWIAGDSGPRAWLRLDDLMVRPVRDPGTKAWMLY